MNYFRCSRYLRSAAVVCLMFTACFSFSDEWKARHALISPTGVMNLSELPLAEEIWGNDWNPKAIPAANRDRALQPPANVDAFPQGASPLDVLDLEGNVSQWTDEFRDPHTRAAMVRGGAAYQPRGSIRYFPQTYRLDEHQKYLLMSPGRDRAGTIGFRCVVDAPGLK